MNRIAVIVTMTTANGEGTANEVAWTEFDPATETWQDVKARTADTMREAATYMEQLTPEDIE